MASTADLKITITAINEVKKVLADIRGDFNAARDALFGMATANTDKLAKGLSDLNLNAKGAVTGLGGIGATAEAAAAGMGQLVSGLKFLAGGFLALKSVQFVKDLADIAARTETLGIVLHQVGSNAGYTIEALDAADKAVQKMGITASASRESLTQLIQARIPLDFAAPLARAAQDLAVISGLNSSDTFSRLITNIQQMDTMGLRFMGIMINKEEALAKASAEAGNSLTGRAAKQAFANAVLQEASKLEGTYEAAMLSAGKQLTSMPRYIENLKVSIGNQLLPVYAALVKGTLDILDALKSLSDAWSGVTEGTAAAGEGMWSLAEGIKSAVANIVDMIKWMKEHKEVIDAVVTSLGYLLLAFAAFKVISIVAALVSGFMVALTGLITVMTGVAVAGASMWLAVLGPVAGIVAAIALIGGGLALAWTKYKESVTGAADSMESNADKAELAAMKYVEASEKLIDLSSALNDASSEEAVLHNRLLGRGTSPEARKALEAELASVQARKKALQDDISALVRQQAAAQQTLDRFKPSDAAQSTIRAVQELAAAKKAADDEEKARKEDLTSALKDAGVEVGELLTGQDKKLRDLNAAQNAQLEDLIRGNGNAGNSIRLLSDEYAKMATSISTPEALKLFNEGVDNLRKRAYEMNVPSAAGGIANASQAAADSVDEQEKARKAGGEKILAAQRALGKAMATLREQQTKQANSTAKIDNEEELRQLDEKYARGIGFTEDYYAKRRELARKNTALEISDLEAANRKLVTDRNALPVGSRAGIQEINNQIAANEAKIKEASKKGSNEIAALDDKHAQDKVLKAREVQRLQNDLIKDGAEKEKALIEEVNLKLEERLSKQGTTAEEASLLHLLASRERELIVMEQANERLQTRLNLEKALRDLEVSRIANLQREGQMTSNEAQKRRNELKRQEIEGLREQAFLQEHIIRETEHDPDRKDTTDKAKQRLVELRNEMETVRAGIGSLGLELQRTFTDSLSNGLQGLIEQTTNLGDVIKSVARDMARMLMNNSVKDLAEQTTRGLINATGGKDNPDKSVFGVLGGLVSGDQNAIGANRSGMPEQVGGPGINGIPDEVVKAGIGDSVASVWEKFSSSMEEGSKGLGDLMSRGGLGLSGLWDSLSSSLASIFSSLSGGGGTDYSAAFAAIGGGMAGGGMVTGPGTGTSDSVPIRASAGEFVVNAKSTSMWLPVLHAINRNSMSAFDVPHRRSFASGGVVDASGGSGGGMVNNIDIHIDQSGSADVSASGSDKSAALGRQISGAVVQELIKQKRPGGILASN